MASVGKAAFDLAARRAEQECEASIALARTKVSARGTFLCEDCTLPIDDERRRAAPFARRCISCQRIHEHASRRRCA